MSAKAKAMMTLYRIKKVDISDLRLAVEDAIITKEEYKLITWEDYPMEETNE